MDFFIPIGIIAYLLFNLIQHLTLYFFMWLPFSEYLSMFIKDLMSIIVGLSVALLVAPKGRIIIASIITGLAIMMFGITVFMIIFLFEYDGFMPIVGISLNLAACICVLVNLIRNRDSMEFVKSS